MSPELSHPLTPYFETIIQHVFEMPSLGYLFMLLVIVIIHLYAHVKEYRGTKLEFSIRDFLRGCAVHCGVVFVLLLGGGIKDLFS
jgi:hypothetical protein